MTRRDDANDLFDSAGRLSLGRISITFRDSGDKDYDALATSSAATSSTPSGLGGFFNRLEKCRSPGDEAIFTWLPVSTMVAS